MNSDEIYYGKKRFLLRLDGVFCHNQGLVFYINTKYEIYYGKKRVFIAFGMVTRPWHWPCSHLFLGGGKPPREKMRTRPMPRPGYHSKRNKNETKINSDLIRNEFGRNILR